MIKRAIFVCLLMASVVLCLDTISVIGHIPGAACKSVEYLNEMLYTGAGSSLFIYECENPADMSLLGYVNFYSLVTHIIVREDGMVFVGANRDALYAVDASTPESPVILARYRMPNRHHWVADIQLTGEDTIWLCDNNSLKKLYFTGDTFLVVDEYFSGQRIVGVDFRDNLAVVSRRGVMWIGQGHVELYDRVGGGFEHITTFSSNRLTYMCDAQFADNRDDIIYVLGGSPNMGGDGDFFALHYNGTSLNNVTEHRWSGIPGGIAQVFIMNMDSRNDTVYLATMAGIYWGSDSPWVTCPVLDGTHLPDSMPIIGNFVPGLWFFDVALHDNYPALATASEWLGVWWSDISDFSERWDTIRTYPTGGWGHDVQLYGGDTLFISMRGYGIGIYDVRDRSNPLNIGRIPGEYAHGTAFIDSVICVVRSGRYLFFNLAPWWRGGEIEPLDTFMIPRVFGTTYGYINAEVMKTSTETVFVLGTTNRGIDIVDPADIPSIHSRAQFFHGSHPVDILCFGDTLFLLMQDSLHIVRYLGDTLEHIAKTAVGANASGFCRSGSFIAITRSQHGINWYEWTGSSITGVGSWNPWGHCADCEFFDSLLYVVCQAEGLFVLDIGDYPVIDTLAWFSGSQGWEFLQYGSVDIYFGADSTIYIADWHGGAYILEPFHRGTLEIVNSSVISPEELHLTAYPNPFNSAVHIKAPEHAIIEIFDILGNRVALFEHSNPIWTPDGDMPSGIFNIRATKSDGNVSVVRVVYLK